MKHLVPTTSPERIWMELDCLRVANGKENVIPLLFGHRLDGDVILAMPFIHTIRFGELIKDITMSEARWVPHPCTNLGTLQEVWSHNKHLGILQFLSE